MNPERVESLLGAVADSGDRLVELTRALVRIPTEAPVGDTTAAVRLLERELAGVRGIEVSIHTAREPVRNLVASVKGRRPGRRLVLNGHLDTYPAGDRAQWSHDPHSGTIRDGRLYGRGSADMKGGVACLVRVFEILAADRGAWEGELVLTLAGDEETMGSLGSGFLLRTSEKARGDAVLNADVGSPLVPRIGEKGMVWVDVSATGRPAHGAHVHRGENAIDRLRAAMDAMAGLPSLPVSAPPDVDRSIDSARPVSEPLGGAGETRVLKGVTVNFGRIWGGESANLVPGRAGLSVDIRLPMGIGVAAVERELGRLLQPLPGIRFEVTRRYEPSWTSPDEPIVSAVADACETVLGSRPPVGMRVGASDARLFRAAGIPSVVCGLTPHNLGAPDEFLEIEELADIAGIHLLAAAAFLSPG